MRQAVIDLGWTNVSLLVAEERNGQLVSILKDFVPFPVARYTSKMMVMDEKGCAFLSEAVRGFRKKAEDMGSAAPFLISTTLLRKANNPSEVKRSIEKGTGLEIREMTGYGEAKALLIVNERYSVLEKPLLINIGVSSMELSDYSKPDVSGMVPLPFGAFELRSNFMEGRVPERDEQKRMKDYVESFLGPFGDEKYENGVLTGRNMNALHALYSDWFGLSGGDEKLMQRRRLSALCDVLTDSKKGTRLIERICPDKTELIVPSALALMAIVEHFRINNMTVSPLGVKEGFLRMKRDGLDGREEVI